MQGSGDLEMFLSDASDIIPRILSCAERSLISAWEYSWPSNVSLDNQSHSTIELDIYLEVRPQLFRFSEEKLRTINAKLCVFFKLLETTCWQRQDWGRDIFTFLQNSFPLTKLPCLFIFYNLSYFYIISKWRRK